MKIFTEIITNPIKVLLKWHENGDSKKISILGDVNLYLFELI